MSEKPKMQKELCRNLRIERRQGRTYEDLDEDYSIDITDIIKHIIGECQSGGNNDGVESIDTSVDEPWKEEYVLERLYIDKGMRFTEISNLLKCHSGTVTKYVDKFEVSPIDSSDRTSSPRVNRIQRLGKEGKSELDS